MQNRLDVTKYPEVLTADDVKGILGIGKNQAYNLMNSGQFHVVRIGRLMRVSREVFFEWLEGVGK